jgi:hypothetical protein
MPTFIQYLLAAVLMLSLPLIFGVTLANFPELGGLGFLVLLSLWNWVFS